MFLFWSFSSFQQYPCCQQLLWQFSLENRPLKQSGNCAKVIPTVCAKHVGPPGHPLFGNTTSTWPSEFKALGMYLWPRLLSSENINRKLKFQQAWGLSTHTRRWFMKTEWVQIQEIYEMKDNGFDINAASLSWFRCCRLLSVITKKEKPPSFW